MTNSEQEVLGVFKYLGEVIEQQSMRSGFWEGDGVNDYRKIALIHCELSELVEGLRKGNPADEHCPEFLSAEIEAADVFIRLIEWCRHRKIRIGEAILAKMAFNATRGFKHGRRF